MPRRPCCLIRFTHAGRGSRRGRSGYDLRRPVQGDAFRRRARRRPARLQWRSTTGRSCGLLKLIPTCDACSDQAARDRILIALDDTDGDGRFDAQGVCRTPQPRERPSNSCPAVFRIGAQPLSFCLFPTATATTGPMDRQRFCSMAGASAADTHETPNSFAWGPDGNGPTAVMVLFTYSRVGKPGAASTSGRP